MYETNDVFASYDQQEFVGYQIVATAFDDWQPLVLMPDRVTDHFKGRESEISEISDWADDTESRACMLFGDGGIGKTTLAIEFIHRLLDGQLKINWKPELITFYTAKLTRWGLNGLEVIRTKEVGVLDTVVTIVRGFESKPLGREWFDALPRDLIQKLTSYLLEYGSK